MQLLVHASLPAEGRPFLDILRLANPASNMLSTKRVVLLALVALVLGTAPAVQAADEKECEGAQPLQLGVSESL